MASVFPEMTEKMQMLYTDIIASLGTLPPEKKIYIFGADDNVNTERVIAVTNYIRSFIKGGNAPESRAYFAGNRLEEYMKGMR